MNRSSRWLQAVSNMLRNGLVEPGIELREEDEGSTCEPVRLRGGRRVKLSFNAKFSFKAKDPAVCVKDRLFPLFREVEGVTRMCDYWILCEQGDENPVLYVLLCELKSAKTTEALAQIENGKLLAEYFLAMVGHHENLGAPRVEYRGLVFSRRQISKPEWKVGENPYKPMGRLSTKVAYLRDGTDYSLSSLCT